MDLDDLISRLAKLPPKEMEELREKTGKLVEGLSFVPNPGPQTEAYFSEADVLLFGGEPAGGKTLLILGLAFNCHQKSLILRKQYTDLGGVIESALKLNGGRDGFNGSPPPSLRRPDGRKIDFGAAARVGDEMHWQGIEHDLIAVDEAAQFAESQIRFLMGWLRSSDPNQRKRVVLASNPPLTAEGLWIIQMFAPWLDEKYPNPAKPGELRWVVTDEAGKDKWVNGPEPVKVGDKMVKPTSRSYMPSSLADNPFLSQTGYQSQLDAMPEPYRSILLGGFKRIVRDQENQVIPTEWVLQAFARWKPEKPEGVPMCVLASDIAQGGQDETVIATRYDNWYDKLEAFHGEKTPYGRDVAGLILARRRDMALVVVDLGGGYGGATYEHLQANDVEVVGFKGAEGTTRRSRDGKLRFVNKRSAAHWLFREALDPGQPGGATIALCEDRMLLADLTAPTFEPTPNGIKVEAKEKVCERLGRSTDRGDTVVMAWFEGPKEITHALEWADQRQRKVAPKVVMSSRYHRR